MGADEVAVAQPDSASTENEFGWVILMRTLLDQSNKGRHGPDRTTGPDDQTGDEPGDNRATTPLALPVLTAAGDLPLRDIFPRNHGPVESRVTPHSLHRWSYRPTVFNAMLVSADIAFG